MRKHMYTHYCMHKHAHIVTNKHILHAHTVLGRYSEKVIYYVLLITATAVKSITVTYLILNVTSNILHCTQGCITS